MLIGYYSAQAAYLYGSAIYSTPSGGEVEVTFVKHVDTEANYGWADKVVVGQVVKYLREGKTTGKFQERKDAP